MLSTCAGLNTSIGKDMAHNSEISEKTDSKNKDVRWFSVNYDPTWTQLGD